jgi:hypothetical protein
MFPRHGSNPNPNTSQTQCQAKSSQGFAAGGRASVADARDKVKRRPVIVVEPETSPGSAVAVVICCSETAGPREPDSIPLPNRAEEPQTRTGPPSPCSATPRWFLPIDHATLQACQFSGHLGGRS